MTMLKRRAVPAPLFAPLALLALAIGAGCLVEPTNPYDDATPSSLQAKGVITGQAVFPSLDGEAPPPPDGITVWAQLVGAPEGEREAELVTVEGANGRFTLEVSPGNYFVWAEHPAYASATVGPLRLSPAQEIDVGVVELRQPEATASMTGTVVTQGGISAQGVEVSVVRLLSETTCSTVAAKTNTGADGSFTFDALRPGDYAVVAKTEGATVDVLYGAERVSLSVDEAYDLTLERRALSLQPASGVLQIEADGVFPTSTSRSAALSLHVATFGGMEEMQLGGDPTFDPSLGGTGWRAFADVAAFTLPDAEGEWTVYAQLRSSCVTSPLYSARVAYDASPPEIISAQVGAITLDPSVPPPTLVAGPAAVGLQWTLNVIDDVGVARVHFEVTSGATTTTQIEAIEPEPGQALLRATAIVPAGEGRYPMRVLLEDAAGNITPMGEEPEVIALRDVGAPTTPIPLASFVEVSAKKTLVWVRERDCDDGSRGLACEVNPHPDGILYVRGGVTYPDFTGVSTSPFEIELFDDGETLVEIQARDAAGQLSPGTARVTLQRAPARRLFTAPEGKELGPPTPPLVNRDYGFVHDDDTQPPRGLAERDRARLHAASGTAFFSLRPVPDQVASSYYSFLLAQPVDAPDVGLVVGESQLPRSIRKLAFADGAGLDLYDLYERQAGALGAGGGALTWLEAMLGSYGESLDAMRYVVFPDGDGRYELQMPLLNFNPGYDQDGELAFNHLDDGDLCVDRGHARCQPARYAWRPYQQLPPLAAATDGTTIVTSATGVKRATVVGSDEGTVSVTGPQLIGINLQAMPPARSARVQGFAMPINVPEGTILHAAYYWEVSGGYWDSRPYPGLVDDMIAHVATGDGWEVFEAPERFWLEFDEQQFIGLFVPAGVTIEVPVLGTPDAGDYAVPLGLVHRDVPDLAQIDEIDFVDPAGYDRADVVPRMVVLVTDSDISGTGTLGGLTATSWGADGEPYAFSEPNINDLFADPSLVTARRDDSNALLIDDGETKTWTATGAADSIGQPPEGTCSLLVRVDRDVAIRDIRVPGAGLLDWLQLNYWSLEGSSPLGRYQHASIRDQAPDGIALYPEEDVYDCADNEETLVDETLSGSVASQVISSDQQVVSAAANIKADQDFIDLGPFASGTYIQVGNLPVQQGDVVTVTQTAPNGPTGDLDLYVRFNNPPAPGSFDCRPYANGSNETCNLTAAAGDATVYIATNVYTGPSDYAINVRIEAEGNRMHEYGPYTVQTGDIVHATTTGPVGGDVQLLTAYGYSPQGAFYDDCRSYNNGNEEVCLTFTPDDETEIYVNTYDLELPVDYTLDVSVLRPEVAQLKSYDVLPGQRVRVVTTGTNHSLPMIGFDAEPTHALFDCRPSDEFGEYNDNTVCEADVPSGVSKAYVAVSSLEVDTDFDAQVTISQVGCAAVLAGYTGSGVLRGGHHYVISLSSQIYTPYDTLDWSTYEPSIEYGDAIDSPFVEVLGTVGAADVRSDELIVSAYDPQAPRCRIELELGTPPWFDDVALRDGQVVAVRNQVLGDGSVESKVMSASVDGADLVGSSPQEVATAGAGRRIVALGFEEAGAYWLEADEQGGAQLWRRRIDDGVPQFTSCQVLTLSGDYLVASGSIGSGKVAITGNQAGQPVVDVFALDPAGPCEEPVRVTRRTVDGQPVAVTIDHDDLFVWHDAPQAGGALAHFDLRELSPVHPGGSERVIGFDPTDEGVVVSLADVDDALIARALHVRYDAAGGFAGADELSSSLWLQPRTLPGGVAWIEPSGGSPDAPQLRLRRLDDPAAAPVSLAGADALLAYAPAFDATDAIAWARAPLFETDGTHVALLGFNNDGTRRLAVWELPADPGMWAATSPSLEVDVEDDGADIAGLFLTDGLVVVTSTDVTSPATAQFRVPDSGGLWQPAYVPAAEQSRVIGVADGKLVVVDSPGPVFAQKPPVHALVRLVTPQEVPDIPDAGFDAGFDAGADAGDAGDAGYDGGYDGGLNVPPPPVVDLAGSMRVPAELFLHQFERVEVDSDGALLLHDVTAQPAALWRLEGAGRFAVISDAASRPLTAGAETIGVSAAPRAGTDALYWVQRTASGTSLLRKAALR
jgi:hypothetical protein